MGATVVFAFAMGRGATAGCLMWELWFNHGIFEESYLDGTPFVKVVHKYRDRGSILPCRWS